MNKSFCEQASLFLISIRYFIHVLVDPKKEQQKSFFSLMKGSPVENKESDSPGSYLVKQHVISLSDITNLDIFTLCFASWF